MSQLSLTFPKLKQINFIKKNYCGHLQNLKKKKKEKLQEIEVADKTTSLQYGPPAGEDAVEDDEDEGEDGDDDVV